MPFEPPDDGSSTSALPPAFPADRGWVRGEQPIMLDGQLGDAILAGVERVNPEGTGDIARPLPEPGRGR
jgi:hypothetical protein